MVRVDTVEIGQSFSSVFVGNDFSLGDQLVRLRDSKLSVGAGNFKFGKTAFASRFFFDAPKLGFHFRGHMPRSVIGADGYAYAPASLRGKSGWRCVTDSVCSGHSEP
jgi:hypothetical protein